MNSNLNLYNDKELSNSESVSKLFVSFAVVLIIGLLAALVYLIAPDPVTKMQTTAVNDFYSNSAPPSIPKWARASGSRGITFVQPAALVPIASPVSDDSQANDPQKSRGLDADSLIFTDSSVNTSAQQIPQR